jgi:hypothetical protein
MNAPSSSLHEIRTRYLRSASIRLLQR